MAKRRRMTKTVAQHLARLVQIDEQQVDVQALAALTQSVYDDMEKVRALDLQNLPPAFVVQPGHAWR